MAPMEAGGHAAVTCLLIAAARRGGCVAYIEPTARVVQSSGADIELPESDQPFAARPGGW